MTDDKDMQEDEFTWMMKEINKSRRRSEVVRNAYTQVLKSLSEDSKQEKGE